MDAGSGDAFWHKLADVAQTVGGFATALGVLVAVIAAVILLLQTRSNSRTAHEASALETHRDYLKLCIERPELSSSEAMLDHLRRRSFKGILSEPVTPETERALWFLSYVLHTAEQLLETTGGSKEWATVVHSQLSFHEDLLTETWPEWKKHYGRRLRSIVETEISKRPAIDADHGRGNS